MDCIPARARAADEVEHLTRLYGRKTGLFMLVIELRHEALQDAERRQSAYPARATAGRDRWCPAGLTRRHAVWLESAPSEYIVKRGACYLHSARQQVGVRRTEGIRRRQAERCAMRVLRSAGRVA